MRLSMSTDDFYNNDTQTNFVDRIAAFLAIPPNKLKVVGIREARRILDSHSRSL